MNETIFTWGAPPLKFGPGAIDEIGFEMSQYDVSRVLIITDATISATGIPQRIQEQLTRYRIRSEIFDGVHVEPTDDSMDKAAGYAREQSLGRLRGGRRRLGDRHRQGGQPDHHRRR